MTMSTDHQTSRDLAPPPAAPIVGDLPLFRFGLRQLLIFVSLMSMLMAAMVTLHGLLALVLLLAILVVVFHLFSTALGTQLRWHANHARNREPPQATSPDLAQAIATRSGSAQPPRSPWHERRSTPLPWLPRLVVTASMLGGVAGAVLLSGTIGHRTSPAGIAVGSFSLAVIAGWFTFVGYSFCGVFRHGLRDAMSADIRDQSR